MTSKRPAQPCEHSVKVYRQQHECTATCKAVWCPIFVCHPNRLVLPRMLARSLCLCDAFLMCLPCPHTASALTHCAAACAAPAACCCRLCAAAVKVQKATCSAPGQRQVSGRKML
jgi:hypothetical protein